MEIMVEGLWLVAVRIQVSKVYESDMSKSLLFSKTMCTVGA